MWGRIALCCLIVLGTGVAGGSAKAQQPLDPTMPGAAQPQAGISAPPYGMLGYPQNSMDNARPGAGSWNASTAQYRQGAVEFQPANASSMQGPIGPGGTPLYDPELGGGEFIVDGAGQLEPMEEMGGSPPWCKPWAFRLTPRWNFIEDADGRFTAFDLNGDPVYDEVTRQGGGAAMEVDVELTSYLTFTSAADIGFFSTPDSNYVGDGPHVVLSFVLNCDPMLENIFYGAAVDVYKQPSIDPLNINNFSQVVVGQWRVGGGFSTCFGDVLVRGGGNIGDDIDESVSFFDPTTALGLQNVQFAQNHIEIGLETKLFGVVDYGLFCGFRDGQIENETLQYLWMDYAVPLSMIPGTPELTGDLYWDYPENVGFNVGLTFYVDRGLMYDHRRALKPYSITHANRMMVRTPDTP